MLNSAVREAIVLVVVESEVEVGVKVAETALMTSVVEFQSEVDQDPEQFKEEESNQIYIFKEYDHRNHLHY